MSATHRPSVWSDQVIAVTLDSENTFYLVAELRAQRNGWSCKQLSQWKILQLLPAAAPMVLVMPSLKELPAELLLSLLLSVSVWMGKFVLKNQSSKSQSWDKAVISGGGQSTAGFSFLDSLDIAEGPAVLILYLGKMFGYSLSSSNWNALEDGTVFLWHKQPGSHSEWNDSVKVLSLWTDPVRKASPSWATSADSSFDR